MSASPNPSASHATPELAADAPLPATPSTPGHWRLAVIALLLALVAPLSICVEAFGWGKIGSQTVLISSLDSRDRVIREMPSPKVILVSGSNLFLGVDVPRLAEMTGLPVANQTLPGAIGIDLIAEQAARHVERGDLVVLAPEWSNFFDRDASDIADPMRLEILRRYGSRIDTSYRQFPMGPVRMGRARAAGWIDIVRGKWLVMINRVLRGDAPSLYQGAKVADDAGNLLPGFRPAPRRPESIVYTTPEAVARRWAADRSRAADALDVLADVCRREGATLCVMPPVRLRRPDAPFGTFNTLEAQWFDFAKQRVGARALLALGETEFPPDQGFDTEYHLNDIGVVVMTDRLAAALTNEMKGDEVGR